MKKQLLSQKRLSLLFCCLCLMLCANLGWGQTVVSFTTAGTTTWTCPPGVTSVQVEAWGGGGGGGGTTGTINRSGGGGGGGSYNVNTIAVVPGVTYNVIVGAGGLQGQTAQLTTFGLPGGKSEFSGANITTITASGGTGGGGGTSPVPNGAGGVLGGVYGFNSIISGTPTYISGTTTVTFAGGGGSGASAAISTSSNVISNVSPISMGTGYTSAPTVTLISNGTGTGASAIALVNPNIDAGGTITRGQNGSSGLATSGGAGGNGGAGGAIQTSTGVGNNGSAPGGGGGGALALTATSGKGGNGAVGKIVITFTAATTNYYYKGTGDLTLVANWGTNTDGSGLTPSNFTSDLQVFQVRNTAAFTTTTSWTVSGANSKIVLGDSTQPAITLTVASGFPITGTIDIAAAANSGSNSLVLQDAVTPTFGTLHVSSEVHYNAVISTPIFTTSTVFGKVIIDAPVGQVSWVGNPVIQANGSLTVASGSTLFISGSSAYWTTINPGASVVINGTVRIQKVAGFVNSNITTGTSYGSLQFTGAENLTLGANSIIEYDKASNASTYNITARSYVNLTISGLDNNKAFLGDTTVTGKLVINTTGNSVLTALTNLTPLTISSTGSLILTSGTLNTGGFLTLQSSECCTATVAPVGGNISGNVTVERYIPAGQRAYRLLSSPVTTTTFIDTNWQAGTHITGTGGAANGFDATTSNGSSMFTHDNTTPAWNAIANTNATVLTAGVPYLTYIRGSRAALLTVAASSPAVSIVSDAATLRATGNLKTGNVLVNGLNETAGGFSAVGNPYQAQVDMKRVLVTNATSNNVAPYYYVIDPKLGTKGAYATIDAVTPSNGTAVDANQYLQPGQACFVQTIAAGPASLNFTEADKFEGTQTSVFRTKNTTTATIALTLSDVNANKLDVLKVAFDASESNDVNQNDASKLTNFDESIATFNSGKLLAIEKRGIPTDSDEIPLNITKYRGTSYTLKAEGSRLTGSTPYLFDKYTGATTEIPQYGSVNYAYTVDAAIPASIAADRFKLFYAKTLKTSDNELAGFALYPNPSQSNSFSVVVPQSNSAVSLCVSNLLGQQLYLQNDIQSGATVKVIVDDLKTSGVYLVSLSSEGKTTTTKWILE